MERGPDAQVSVKGARLRRASRSDGKAALDPHLTARQEALQAIKGEPRPCPVLAPADGWLCPRTNQGELISSEFG